MRLGGPVFDDYDDPAGWIAALRRMGWRAAYCPVDSESDDATMDADRSAAKSADIVIAEVGAWSNPLSRDDQVRSEALELCRSQLALADKIGANCCVNIAGSLGEKWDGPHRDDLAPATYNLIVESVQGIIDHVKPKRTFYCLETMPWMYPDSADCYQRLIKDIDRPQFAVHLDPTNLISSPQRFFDTGGLISECMEKLGPHIKSCHAKDIAMGDGFMVHLDEVRPGTGVLDYHTWLPLLDALDDDVPVMLEHLTGEDEYAKAATFVRGVAKEVGVAL